MSGLKRQLSLRMSRRSYKTLPAKNKCATIEESQKEIAQVTGTFTGNIKKRSHTTTDTPTSNNSRTSKKSLKMRAFPSLNSVKSALSNVKQKVKGSQMRRVKLGDVTSVTNSTYVTPRRSDRLKSKASPSPISLKLYSPFCIETPGMDDSFIRISKRKALTELNESPLTKTPRRMVKAGVQTHKQLANSLSSSQLARTSSSGY
ncbi:uncharacterized protein [Watersipora subatra]|uniref:uncharacterized protein n=1 Tax=Watersipora subatra TaxID=2589382 RepID=UPI00355C3996